MSVEGKVQVADGVPGAAKALREMANLTANHTKNWDNYEQICLQILTQVYEAGVASNIRLDEVREEKPTFISEPR